ncbi:MAG: FAD-dependent oxidoreductase [Ruminiclostridium sp.]|nr:FAD-dependent oxidoreductase [Ruminiclostridium sp.]
MSQKYNYLFTPLKIGSVTVKNRFCAGPLTLPSVFGPFGEFSPNGIEYFEARARGGFGLIFTGAMHPDVHVDPIHPYDSKQPLKSPAAFKRSAIELLERTEAYGCKIFPQVSMGYGRNSIGCFAPSEIPYYYDPSRKAPALTKSQIKIKIHQMVSTASLLKQCGFPGMEVHAMHWGYLIDQFAMSFMNSRNDEYGGELENRLRVSREIIEGIKQECGQDFAVSMRLALKSYIKDYNTPSLSGQEEAGRTLAEGLAIAKRLEEYGYDCLSVDFGQYDSFYYAAPPCYMEKGRILTLAEKAKKVVNIPILCGGRMNDPDLASDAVSSGKIDAIVLARPSLADPDYPIKVQTGCPEEIRPCIACNQGCIGALKQGKRAGCAVNAQAAREGTFGLTPALKKKSILIIGGGVAGMEAARVSALRGHSVSLWEKSDVLGGSLRPAGAHEFKQEMNDLNNWYIRQLKKLEVTVHLQKNASSKDILEAKPDTVIMAVGAEPTLPPIPGIDHSNVFDCVTALSGNSIPGQTVVVIGGGLVGCEIALGLAQEGKQVTIIEFLPDILSGSGFVPEQNEQMMRDLLNDLDVRLKTGYRVKEIFDQAVVCSKDSLDIQIPAESVIIAAGFHPRNSMSAEIIEHGIPVYEIGDGKRVSNVMTAISDAYTVARSI